MTPRDGAENQEINDTLMIGERIQKKNDPMEPNETDIRVRVETEITNEKPLIIDVLKALMIKNETEDYLLFKKLDQRRLSDVTKKVNAVISHIEKDDVTQTNLLWQQPFGFQKKLE